MENESAIRAEKLTKEYGGDTGLFDLDLDVSSGSILGLIGPSGSGKTTTVRLLTGLLTPDSGDVRVLGQEPRHFDDETRSQIGYMPQESILYPTLTLRQNLRFAGSLYGMGKGVNDRIGGLAEFLGLDSVIDRLPGDASGGEKRRTALAATLLHGPELLFLDEPTAGLDPVLRRKLWSRFEELAASGKTFLVTTQYVGEAAYCDRVAVLNAGRVLALDTPDGLRRMAYGGELVDVSFPNRPAPSVVQFLESISVGDHLWIDDQTIRITVGDGGMAVPEIVKWAGDHQVELAKSEVYVPEFDDVFVELVENLAPVDDGSVPEEVRA